MLNREKLSIYNELLKKHFKLQKPALMYRVLYETNNDKEKNSKSRRKRIKNTNTKPDAYKVYIIIMEAIFMNTENSKTNESRRFRLDLTDKLNLKNPKKKYGFS